MNNAPASPYLMVGNMPLTLDPRYQHKSGIGANYGFDAGGSLPVADGVNMIAAASVNNMDFRGKSYDDRATRLSAAPIHMSAGNVRSAAGCDAGRIHADQKQRGLI